MLRLLIATASLLLILPAHGQNFAYVTNNYGVTVQGGSPLHGCGVSCYDYSGDGWDDLTFGTEGNGIYLYLNTGSSFELDTILMESGQVTSVVWGDYDNDGDKDLFAGVYNGLSHLYEQSDNGFHDVASDKGIPQIASALTFGASWHDYDLDGDVDLYICNYNWGDGLGNWFLRNDGGTFTSVDMGNDLTNADYPTFMATFADFNNDGLPDVHIINDKLPPNELFENNGDGTFTEISEDAGIDVVTDAMSNSICDYDRDGDLDIYVAADHTGNYLYRNDGNLNFTEVAQEEGLFVERFCWAAQWLDFDNSGFVDLFISTTTPIDNNLNPLYRAGNGTGAYTQLNGAFDFPNTTSSYSNAKGDWNQDGFPDLLQFTEDPSSMGLWENNGNQNHWIGVKLNPTISNPDAIGTWVTCNTPTHSQQHYTLSGEGYMGQNSGDVLFGLGDQNDINYLKVQWPSGWTDFIENPEHDNYLEVTEGETYSFNISYEDDLYLCEGDSIVLDAGDHEEIVWSNGVEGRYCTLYAPITVQATILTSYGFEATSSPIAVEWAPETQMNLTLNHPLCAGSNNGHVFCDVPEGSVLHFEDELSEANIYDLESGTYQIELIDPFGCHYSQEIELIDPLPISLAYESQDPLCHDSQDGWIAVNSSGGTGTLTQLPENSDLIDISAGDYLIELIDENGCEYAETITITAPDPIELEFVITHASEDGLGSCEAIIQGGTSPYQLNWSTGEIGNPQTDLSQGGYVLTIIDENGCVSTWPFNIDLITRIHGLDSESIAIYPNPFHEQIVVKSAQARSYLILDAQGKQVAQGMLNNSVIDLRNLSTGSYFLHLSNENGKRMFTQRIVKR